MQEVCLLIAMLDGYNHYDNDESDKGFAHYYINRNTIARVEDTYNGSWSTANYDVI